MAGSDYNAKYTNERYMTRMEVAKSLGTNLIDGIWREILSYRKGLTQELPIRDNAKFSFGLTLTPKVISLSENLANRINKYQTAFDKLQNGSIAKYTFSHEMIKLALKCIAKLNNIDISEITLQNIIEHQCDDPNYRIVINYYKCLERLSKASYEQVGEEFLANYYAILKGQEELTSFYRMYDNNSPSARFLVGAEFNNGVPVHRIEEMMNEVLSLANDRGLPLLYRIVGTIFMFNYIKPFDDYNVELSLLVVKAMLSGTGLGASSVYIPLEFIANNSNFYGEISREVQKSHDFTYAYLEASETIDKSFQTVIDRLIQVNAKALESSYHGEEDVKKFKQEFGVEPQKAPVEQPQIEPVAKPQAVVEPVIKPAVYVAPAPAPVRETRPTSELSERELKAREVDILESDPYIKKGQAHFYVRHCTKGKFYTIQEYKRCEGCVYETARTSMDNLAYRGYYRREQIKNKFVYTPIDKE